MGEWEPNQCRAGAVHCSAEGTLRVSNNWAGKGQQGTAGPREPRAPARHPRQLPAGRCTCSAKLLAWYNNGCKDGRGCSIERVLGMQHQPTDFAPWPAPPRPPWPLPAPPHPGPAPARCTAGAWRGSGCGGTCCGGRCLSSSRRATRVRAWQCWAVQCGAGKWRWPSSGPAVAICCDFTSEFHTGARQGAFLRSLPLVCFAAAELCLNAQTPATSLPAPAPYFQARSSISCTKLHPVPAAAQARSSSLRRPRSLGYARSSLTAPTPGARWGGGGRGRTMPLFVNFVTLLPTCALGCLASAEKWRRATTTTATPCAS